MTTTVRKRCLTCLSYACVFCIDFWRQRADRLPFSSPMLGRKCDAHPLSAASRTKHGNAVHQREQTSTTCRWRLRVYFLLADLPNPTEVRLSTRGKLRDRICCVPSCLTVAFGEPTAMPISPRGDPAIDEDDAKSGGEPLIRFDHRH